MIVPFDFIGKPNPDAPGEEFLLDVPAGIRSKKDLLAILSKTGKFPEYFGGNWDALLDCLRDFEWVEERKIVIMHNDVPLLANLVDCRIYLETLCEAVNDWTRTAGRSEVAAGSPVYPDHELRVLFPDSARRTVTDILTSKHEPPAIVPPIFKP